MKDNRTLNLHYYPPTFNFDTLVCPLISIKGKVSVNSFSRSGAAKYSGFNAAGVAAFLGRDSKNLYVMLQSGAGKNLRTTWRKDVPWLDDTHEIMIDASHDHQNYIQFIVNPENKRVAFSHKNMPGNITIEHKRQSGPYNKKWNSKTSLKGGIWKTLVIIPFKSLGTAPGAGAPVMGIMLMRHYTDGRDQAVPAVYLERDNHSSWAFMDLTAEGRTLLADKICLGETKLLVDNILTVSGVNRSKESLFNLKLSVLTGDEEKSYYESTATFKAAPGKRFNASGIYRLDHFEWEYQTIRIEITGQDGKKYYEAAYKVSYKHGMMLLYGKPEGENPQPDPKDPDFVEKKYRYLLSRIPDFYRPKDKPFIIKSTDNKVVFDLMKAGALKKIADYVYALFDNDMDRLAGAAFLINRPAFMIYVNILSSIETDFTPLSTLRWQYAQCGSSAVILLGVIEKLRRNKSRKCFTGHMLHINNHVITVVHYKGRHVPLDPSVAKVFYSYDNRDFASYEELLKDARLVSKSGEKYVRLFQRDTVTHYIDHYGRTTWPAGAPAE